MMRIVTLLLVEILILNSAQAAEGPAAKPPCCLKELAPGAGVSELSLYQIEGSWTNDFGKVVRLSSLRGKPQVISMFFSTCQFTCPVLVNDLKRIEAAFPPAERINVGFTLVTFDTVQDTPGVLNAFRETHGLGQNWTLLCGGADEVTELAAALGIKFKKDARGQFAHSNMITVLNSQGEIVRQIPGLNRDPSTAVDGVRENLHSATR